MIMRASREMIGKRIIYSLRSASFIYEGVVQEISPNENYVKINKEWFRISDIKVLDVLD